MKKLRCPNVMCLLRTKPSLGMVIRFGFYQTRWGKRDEMGVNQNCRQLFEFFNDASQLLGFGEFSLLVSHPRGRKEIKKRAGGVRNMPAGLSKKKTKIYSGFVPILDINPYQSVNRAPYEAFDLKGFFLSPYHLVILRFLPRVGGSSITVRNRDRTSLPVRKLLVCCVRKGLFIR